MNDVFNCCKDFLISIYGNDKYCRRIFTEIEMVSILTLLWVSFDSSRIKHNFADKEELYQYLRETFKIKASASTSVLESKHNNISIDRDLVSNIDIKDLESELENNLKEEIATQTVETQTVETQTVETQTVESQMEVESLAETKIFFESQTKDNFVEIEFVVENFKSKVSKRVDDNIKDSNKICDLQDLNKGVNDSDSDSDAEDSNNSDDEIIHPRIAELLAIPQPEQKSLAWLAQRQDYITASVFGASTGLLGVSALTTLLLDKISRGKLNPFNGNQATHWGEKYEPLSNDLYCYKTKAKTYEFGMIAHPQSEINFLGASTDGIAIYKNKLTNIEIKSPFSRKITGIPKPEYWAQMQLQMEILNLDETHFIESKFRECDMDNFWETFNLTIAEIDGINYSELQGDQITFERGSTTKVNADGSKGKEERGIMIEAISLDKYENDGSPKRIYISSPIKYYKNRRLLEEWYKAKIEEIQGLPMVYLKSTGWLVERFSCVYVERDRIWFNNQIETLKTFWSDVINYRQQNLTLERIADLKPHFLNKYKTIINNSNSSSSNNSRNSSSSSNSITYNKSKSTSGSAFFGDDDNNEESIILTGGCMLNFDDTDANANTNTNTNANANANNNISENNKTTGNKKGSLGFGCLLSDKAQIQMVAPTVKQKVKVGARFF